MLNEFDMRGRLLSQEMYSELEKVARFRLNNLDDLRGARKQVADFTATVGREPRGSRKRALERELKKMQNDLRDAEVNLRDRGVNTMQRYSQNPRSFLADEAEPDVKRVQNILDEVNKSRTKKRGIIFKNNVKIPEPPKAPQGASPKKPKGGFMDRTAKKVGYGTMALGGGALGYNMYQNKTPADPYGGAY